MNDIFEVRLGDEEPQPQFSFKHGETGSAPIGDIIAIKAKSKNGKTFLAAILASVILGGKFGNIKPTLGDKSKILFFDTEQNRPNVQALLQRILILRGWEDEHNDRLKVFSLREMHTLQRLKYITDKIQTLKPTAVFIDGLADLAFDFNDIEQSQDIITTISQIASQKKCAIFFVLHTNKNDTNMKGHLGTFAVQKCSDVFYIERDEQGFFNVTETDCRNIPIKDFSFKIDNYGIPYTCKKEINPNDETTKQIQKRKSRI